MTQDELLALIDRAAAEGWQELDLSGKNLTEIPEAIAKLTNLTQLYLYNNQITQIPEAIAKLTNLTQLDLSGNQITEIPLEVLNTKNAKEIFNYLRQIRTSETCK
jgi:internalin A